MPGTRVRAGPPRIIMDATPEARRALLCWLKPEHDRLVMSVVLILQGVFYGTSIGLLFRPSGTTWTPGLLISAWGIAAIHLALSFWNGSRYAERRSRNITHDCDLVIERFNDLLGDLADNDVIAPGPNAHIIRSTDVKH